MPKLVYWEIPSTDVQRSADFYAALFGWTMQPSGQGYMMFSVEDGLGGGIQKVDAAPDHGISVYVGVEDVPATLEKAEGLGATTLHPKTEIGGDYGYWADFKDPGGARVGIWARA